MRHTIAAFILSFSHLAANAASPMETVAADDELLDRAGLFIDRPTAEQVVRAFSIFPEEDMADRQGVRWLNPESPRLTSPPLKGIPEPDVIPADGPTAVADLKCHSLPINRDSGGIDRADGHIHRKLQDDLLADGDVFSPGEELNGVVVELYGANGPCTVAVGQRALAAYRLFMRYWWPWSGKTPHDYPAEEGFAPDRRNPVQHVYTIFTADVDGDRRQDVVAHVSVHWPQETMWETSNRLEIGILFNRPGGFQPARIVHAGVEMDAYGHFPGLILVPGALNNGTPLLLAPHTCCCVIGARVYAIRERSVEFLGEGGNDLPGCDIDKFRMFMLPAADSPARFFFMNRVFPNHSMGLRRIAPRL